jgi:hypothetical protein
VVLGKPLGFEKALSWVAINDEKAAFTVVSYLAAKVGGAIGTVTGPLQTSSGRERLDGNPIEQTALEALRILDDSAMLCQCLFLPKRPPRTSSTSPPASSSRCSLTSTAVTSIAAWTG